MTCSCFPCQIEDLVKPFHSAPHLPNISEVVKSYEAETILAEMRTLRRKPGLLGATPNIRGYVKRVLLIKGYNWGTFPYSSDNRKHLLSSLFRMFFQDIHSEL